MINKQPTKTDIKKLHEELDKIKVPEVDHKAGEELDRLIGWRSLTVEDWYRPFTV